MSFASKCVFYRPEHEAYGAPWNKILKFLRWDKSTDRAQGEDEKNGVKISMVKIMFTSRVIVIKM